MIHPTAIVEPGARLGARVRVGPYSIIGSDVSISDDTIVGPHVVITGHTSIGRENNFYQFCSIGEAPQDKKYKGEPTRVEIGDRNTFREYCTVNRGTALDVGVTRVGNDNWFMTNIHIAHDCQIGSNVVFANNTHLGGHVHVDDFAILGGFTGVHQFCHVGAHCITSVGSAVLQDLPPYVLAQGDPAKPHGINSKGLRRRGFSAEAILRIKRAFKTLYRSGLSLEEAKAQIAQQAEQGAELKVIVEFLRSATRGIMR